MLALYETFNREQKQNFSDICNKLLANTYLARDKRDNREAYYFVLNYKDLFIEFFNLINMELVVNREAGSIYLDNKNSSTVLKLSKNESIVLLILRLLYHEKLIETTLNGQVICKASDIHDKFDALDIKKKLFKTEFVQIIRLFRRYNLVEPLGDITASNTNIVLYPTLLDALRTEEIDSIYQTIAKLNQEGVIADETTN